MFFSSFFDIEKIEINDLAVLQKDVLAGEMGEYIDSRADKWPWGRRNIFVFDIKKLEEFIKDEFFVENVTVDKEYPNILRLKLQERQRSVILVSKNQIYIVDDYGVITSLADSGTASSTKLYLTSSAPIESSKEIYIIAPTSTDYQIGFEYTKPEIVRSWLDLAKDLRDSGIWFKAIELDLDFDSMVKVILKENKKVYFDMSEAAVMQIETLRQFIQTKPNWDDIHEYIDVRVPGRIYYK
ncbi:MAG: cell division protein FtsQ/DivIB [Patescibacteria group bacterium]